MTDTSNPSTAEPVIIQQWRPNGWHRLLDRETGQASAWMPYTQPAYLHGMVGHSAHFGACEGIVTPDKFVRMMAGVDEV